VPAAPAEPARVPALGADTRQVLAEAGLTPAQADALLAAGIAAEPPA
jgi:crotonobetainyl-CoA:carnitine CoA-transferase CaiB-like acyl-CoA transferase